MLTSSARVREGESAQRALDHEALTRGGRVEALICVLMIFEMSFIYSSSKLSFSEDATGSASSQLILLVINVFAIVRLVKMRDVAANLVRRSVPLSVFLGIILLSAFVSTQVLLSFKSGLELVGTTIVAAYLVCRFSLAQFIKILSLTFMVMALFSVVLVFGSPARGRMDWGAGPFNGMFADKNGLGMIMCLGLITLLLAASRERGWRLFGLWCVIGVCVILLLGSTSVSAMFVLFGVLLLGLVAWGFQTKRFGMMFTVGMAFIGAAIVVFGVFGMDSGDIFGMFGKQSNLTGRTEMWPYMIAAVQDRPFLGFGYNTFFQDDSLALEYLAGFIAEYNWLPPHAHDSFIQIALDSGLIGLSSFLVVLCASLRRSISYLMSQKTLVSLWPFAIIAFQTLGSYDETYFAQANTVQWILFVAAVLYAVRSLPLRQVRVDRPSFEVARAS